MNFTFHNNGTITSFNPNKMTKDSSGKRILCIDLHKELVRAANKRSVYIMDQKGRDVDCTDVSEMKQVA